LILPSAVAIAVSGVDVAVCVGVYSGVGVSVAVAVELGRGVRVGVCVLVGVGVLLGSAVSVGGGEVVVGGTGVEVGRAGDVAQAKRKLATKTRENERRIFGSIVSPSLEVVAPCAL
jgi:hypothetical protein